MKRSRSLFSALVLASTAALLSSCDSSSNSTKDDTPSPRDTVVTPENRPIAYGSLTYGGQTYKTVKIGTQTWMAENLNYAGTDGTTGVCYNAPSGVKTSGPADTCAKYGRLYTWAEVMNGSASTTTAKVRGICPEGWHVPTDSEWTTLVNTVEADTSVGAYKGGTALKSTSGWPSGGN